ncbi:MAG: hypothetical protein KBA86_05125 [Bacteroidales bacterium]|nr:hypothetical protein [Bacteroidales bacterium]
MKTLFKTIVFIAILLLFSHCDPDYLKPIHYVDYNPDITISYDTNNLEGISLDLYEDNKNDIYVEQIDKYAPEMTCLHDSIFIYYGDRWSCNLDPILENVGIGNHINYRNWKEVTSRELALLPSNTDVFIALKFIKKDGVHYGWIRFRRDPNVPKWIIKEYAIHNTAEASILTGQKEGE